MPLRPGGTTVSILDSASSFSCTYDYTAKNQGRWSERPTEYRRGGNASRYGIVCKIDLVFTYVVQVCQYQHTASFIYFDCFTAKLAEMGSDGFLNELQNISILVTPGGSTWWMTEFLKWKKAPPNCGFIHQNWPCWILFKKRTTAVAALICVCLHSTLVYRLRAERLRYEFSLYCCNARAAQQQKH